MNKWDKRFMELAYVVGSWSSCFKEDRHVGAIIVKDKRILTTGYNGASSGTLSCVEKGECLRQKLNIKSGTHQEICYAVHAEQNAIIQAAKMGVSVDGATMYVTHQPCSICAKMIINSGISKIIYDQGYPDEFSLEILNEANVELIRYKDLLN
ncbi:MAG: dCMP deaminase family protein [Clostridia bacterium]